MPLRVAREGVDLSDLSAPRGLAPPPPAVGARQRRVLVGVHRGRDPREVGHELLRPRPRGGSAMTEMPDGKAMHRLAQRAGAAPAEHVVDLRPRTGPNALANLLDALRAFFGGYVVLAAPAQSVAIALWAASTYVFEHFDAAPYLAVTSPEKRSGKTRLLDALELLVARPWRAVLPSE